MYGAILGDMVGAPYEFDMGDKTKDFDMWNDFAQFTDDTVMTVAVAEALMAVGEKADEDKIKGAVVEAMRKWGHRYPHEGYGTRFERWLYDLNTEPYNSYGNGSAMRVSSVGWLYYSLERTIEVAKWTAEVTHNHPEGIKGAEVVAGAIYMARNGFSKAQIRKFAENAGYDLSRTCDEIRPGYHHVESCQETVPEAITAFLEGLNFEDCIRTAVSLGGDCDTLTCITGSIAEAMYDVPNDMKEEVDWRLTTEMKYVITQFERMKL